MIGRFMAAWLFCLALAASAAARFDTETMCSGFLNFPNDDGTSVAYDLLIRFDSQGYTLTSTDQETGETIVDSGACTAYAGAGCTHEIEADGEKTGDSYRFRIQKMTATTYAYEEVWADGSVGRTILTCRAGS